MDPLISLRIMDKKLRFGPSEQLEFQYQIDAIGREPTHAVEASVLWYTEGKGDEELSVHFFERRVAADSKNGGLRELYAARTTLPNSPMSYEGVIVKIRWCIRVRLFWGKGKESNIERPFVLGNIPSARSAMSL